ncbi:MAG: hypothetical protein CVV42_17620 [Candidatus Riflebacteria bacterium HGW-Riflebacteria-2]|nr:MAG: hypothetical protein CVV42_17620 [Candidatus Riflebacteria bacterium HGW-Riflebacteria-2]
MKKVLVAAFAAVICCTQAFAFDVSPTQINTGKKIAKKVTVSQEFIRKLFTNKSMVEGIEMLSVTDDGNRLSSIRGTLSSPLSGNIGVAARDYIQENAALFNLPRSDVDFLRMMKNFENDGVTHLTWNMIIDGVFVRNATIELTVDKDGVVTLAHGSLPEINEITNQITLERYQAIGLAKQAIKADKFRAVPEAELQIVAEENGTARMAYVAKLAVENPLGDYEVVVDAETGDIMHVNNEMNFHTGLGAVYVTNPLRCDITKEELLHLTATTPTGEFCAVDNEDGPESDREDSIHIYEPENTHFEEIGMYNYITTIHDFFKTLGHDKLDRPMKAVVHLGDNYDNAYFSPWQGMVAFGDGNKFNCLAREASVAYHEYSHAVLNSIKYLAYSGESGALNEGQADYFACSVTDDPLLGEWVVAKMEKPFLRNVENDLHYPEDIHGEVHADGKIWGAVLWDLRKALGKEVSDILIYTSHYNLKSSSCKFIDGYNAIITADKTLNEGKNIEAIDKVFADRGIVAASYNGAVLTASDIRRISQFKEAHNE